MAIELEKSLEALKRCIDSQHPKEAVDLVKNIQKHFETYTSGAVLGKKILLLTISILISMPNFHNTKL